MWVAASSRFWHRCGIILLVLGLLSVVAAFLTAFTTYAVIAGVVGGACTASGGYLAWRAE